MHTTCCCILYLNKYHVGHTMCFSSQCCKCKLLQRARIVNSGLIVKLLKLAKWELQISAAKVVEKFMHK